MRITRTVPNFDQPTEHLIGRRALIRTYDGDELVGKIETFDGARAIVRMDDGRWGYSNYELELVED